MANSAGRFSIAVTGPGVLAGTTVTDAQCTATSNIAISFSTKASDATGSFKDITIIPASGTFTMTCDRAQLTTTLTGDYVLTNT